MPQPPGVPAPRAQPDYPQHLREKFASRRWIPGDDVELLNFPNTQVLLIGAHADGVEVVWWWQASSAAIVGIMHDGTVGRLG